jgi:hypothetical protein
VPDFGVLFGRQREPAEGTVCIEIAHERSSRALGVRSLVFVEACLV